MASRLLLSVAAIALALVAGCALERGPLDTTGIDASRPDAPMGLDARGDVGPADAGPDVGPVDGGPDAGPSDAGTDAGLDAGPPDAGPLDAGSDAGRDSGPPDAGPPDAGPPDAGPPDAGPPDGGPPDAGPPDAGPPVLRTCVAIYGGLPSYTPCAETATSCTFYVNPSGNSSCDALCGGVGGMCSGAFNEGGTTGCTTGTALTCDSSNNDEVCVCNRIP